MRTLAALVFFALLPSVAAGARDRSGFVAAGIGLPELVRLEVGWWPHDRISVELIAGAPLLAPLAGVAVTGWLLGTAQPGRPPTHTLLIQGAARLRIDDPGRLEARGDALGAAGELVAGYGLLTEGGFVLRALAGAILYEDQGFAAGPQAVVTAGYAF